MQHKQQIQQFNGKFFTLAQSSEKAWASATERYEQYVRGEINKETLRVTLDAAHATKTVLAEASEQKASYDKKYNIFRKLLSASDKHIPLSEIMDCIEKIIVDEGGETVVKWDVS